MFDARAYKTAWMREHRAKKHRKYLISQGKCPISEILLTSKYHYDDCPCGVRFGGFAIIEETIINIHKNKDDKETIL